MWPRGEGKRCASTATPYRRNAVTSNADAPPRRNAATPMRPFTIFAFLLLPGCDVPFAPGVADFREELTARKGVLVSAEVEVTEVQPGHVIRDFVLRSTSGLEVRGRFRTHPDAGPDDPRPVAILLGGVERGGNAISLLPSDLHGSAAALWYPAALDAEDAADALRRMEELAAHAWDIPASILLTTDWLATRPEVAPDRIAVVGASFGGFFAPAAAAADDRLRNVALLYTGGDLAGLLAAHLGEVIPPAAAELGGELAALRLQRLEPLRYMEAIAPRHVLLVNGLDDDLVPRRSARALIDATHPPRDVVWLPTGHLDPDDEMLLRELVDTALSRLPVLKP